MGRKKKGQIRSPSSTLPQASRSKAHRPAHRLAILGAGIACLGFVLAWHQFQPTQSPQKPSRPTLAPEPPPINAAEVLGVSDTPPDDVQGLRAEVEKTCETLRGDLPQRPEVYSLIGVTQYRYGLKDKALEAWRQAARLNENFSPALLGIGLVAADEERNTDAIAALRRTIELNPSTEEAFAKLVEVLLRENETEEALAIARQFTRRFPDNEKASYWLGQSYLQAEQYDKAVAAHKATIEKHPNLTPSYYSLSIALARLGRREEAAKARAQFAEQKKADLEKDRNLNRTYVDLEHQRSVLADTHYSAGNVYLHAGDPRKAEAHWLRGLQIRDGDQRCRQGLAMLYSQQQRWRAAGDVLARLAEQSPEDPNVWIQWAEARQHLGDLDGAEKAYRRAIHIEPESAASYVGLLQLCVRTERDLEDGISLAQKAVELDPSPGTYLLLCTIMEQAGHREEALAAIENAIRLAPGDRRLTQVQQQLRDSR